MKRTLVLPMMARPDGRGDPFLVNPSIDGGPYLLRLGRAMEVISQRVKKAHSEVEEVVFDVDFSLIEEAWRRLGRFRDLGHRRLHVWDFPHPMWAHRDALTICSNCMFPPLEELGPELDAEIGEMPDDQVTLHPAASYPQDLAEDLQDAVLGMTIEQHDECANCGRDFILSDSQREMLDSGELDLRDFLCSQCLAQS